MKKVIFLVATLTLLGILAPVSPGNSNYPNLDSTGYLTFGYAKEKKKKKNKVNKKRKKEREKDTKERKKRLKKLGIPKSFYEDDIGDHLTLQEMGEIIGSWILTVYQETRQIPILEDSSEIPSWLVLNVNGECISSSETCHRWSEDRER